MPNGLLLSVTVSCRKRGDRMKVVKRVIVGVLVAALAAGGIYTGLMHVKESKVTEVPVTSVSNLQTDWYSETTLDGTITTNVSQNVNMDKDMIIEKIYVSQGDDVKKGDNLISFDMTLVEMELNIAKLKQQKQEQDLTKAQNRLTSLQNGGPIEDSTDSTDDTDLNLTGGDTGGDGEMTNTDTPSGSDGDEDMQSTTGSAATADGRFSGFLSDTKIKDIDESNIATTITIRDITKMADQLDHSMGSYMQYFQVLCILLSAVMIYLLTKLIIEKNETAISMTKILGYDNREIASLYLVSTSIVVVISDIISVVLGAKVMDIVWRIMLQTFSGWFSFHMTPVGYVKMFAFVLIGYLIVTVFDFSRIKRIPMDMALKNVE